MSDDELRVSTLELFFDLVFVFTITQLTAVLVHHPNGEALAQIVLMLAAIWWMYGAFAWLTNAVPPDRRALRLPLLGGMLAFFAISLTIPTAFTEDGVVFACAYLVVIAVHTVLYTQSASWTVAGVWSFARMNLVAGALILVGAIIGGTAEYVFWSLAVAIFVGDPRDGPRGGRLDQTGPLRRAAWPGDDDRARGVRGRRGDRRLRHRRQLGAACGRDPRAHPERGALVGLLHGRRRAGRGGPARDGPDPREFFATNVAYYWAHLVMLLGIVCIAAGLERAIGHAFDALSFAQALELGGGTALYLAGHALFRAVLGLSFKPWRAVALVLALATIPLGTETSALVQLAVLVAGLGACNAADGLDPEKAAALRAEAGASARRAPCARTRCPPRIPLRRGSRPRPAARRR